MKTLLTITSLLLFSATVFAEVKPKDCTDNANQIAMALAASIPNGKQMGSAKSSLILTETRPDQDGKMVTTQKDLDPVRPPRSYYVTIGYPIPGPQNQDGRLRQVRQYRISYVAGAFGSPETNAAFEQACYLSSMSEIKIRN